MEEKEELSLMDRLMEYGKTDFYPFHMPGHKRRGLNRNDSFPQFPDPYSIDITEIAGFDNLHHAEGILRTSMDRTAEIYGTDRSYYLVNGSTCGILSAICGCTSAGGCILMARNSHKSAYHSLILNRLLPVYLYPEYVEEFGINGGICPEDVRKALEQDRKKKKGRIQAVFIVSPTYEGIVSDIEAISNIAHEYEIPLIVDEAHGAHLPFAEKISGFPSSALRCGADIVIQSLHKTLPSFTQTAILHVQGNLVDRERIERYLGMFQSSSPSYIFMASMEQCIRYMDGPGRQEMKNYEMRISNFFHSLRGLKVLRVLNREVTGCRSVYDWDPSKIVISVKNAAKDGKKWSGEDLDMALRTRFHLEMEMSAPEYVIGMTSLMDTEEGLKRLSEAILKIDEELSGISPKPSETLLFRAIPVVPMAEAMERKGIRVSLEESRQQISREFVYLYPPGIPILAPGEQVTDEILEQIFKYKEMGLAIQGLSDLSLSSIIIVAKDC